ncbi:Misato segment II tubulin-like domain-containing protein [Entophlyctis helioformis]|nr:Misato segment II tubulin-like domain-containing protein [Entophlyctis helioformis]
MGREIVTLQLGHLASFVGTHFWNTQAAYLESQENELDHDVLYRTGETRKGEKTYTPRLVICDLKGSLGSLKPTSELYEAADQQVNTWRGKVETFESDRHAKNAFLQALDAEDASTAKPSYASDLSSSVQVWSDFNSIYYHPHTIFELTTHVHGDEHNRFLLYSRGRDVYDELAMVDHLLDDRIRPFMEESDNPQGFQVLADTFDGFAGVNAAMMEALQEEYPKKARVVFGISPPDRSHMSREHQMLQDVNQALSLHCMSEAASLYIPLRAPPPAAFGMQAPWNRRLRAQANMYEWSGYLASGIDSVTMPFRLRNDARLDMHDLSVLLNPRASTATAAMAMALPLPLPVDAGVGSLDKIFHVARDGRFDAAWDLTLQTPYDMMDRNATSAFGLFRGISSVLETQPIIPGEPRCTPTQVKDAINMFMRNNGPMMSHSSVINAPFPVHASFPSLFDHTVTPSGLVDDTRTKESPSVLVSQFALYVRLHSSPAIRKLYDSAATTLSSTARGSWVLNDFSEGQSALDRSDFVAIAETLREYSEGYGDVHGLGSNSNDGDDNMD